MADEGTASARAWLHGWQGMRLDADELDRAAGAAHGQVRALDEAVRRLAPSDDPERLRTLLARRARR